MAWLVWHCLSSQERDVYAEMVGSVRERETLPEATDNLCAIAGECCFRDLSQIALREHPPNRTGLNP